MKKLIHSILIYSLALFTVVAVSCSDDDEVTSISLDGTSESVEALNENETFTFTVSGTSGNEIKRASYFVVYKEASGKLKAGSRNAITITEGAFSTQVRVVITTDMHGISIFAIDGYGNESRKDIVFASIRKSPVLKFKNDVDYRNVAAVGMPFNVKGSVTSESDLKQITFTSYNNGAAGTTSNIDLGDKKNVSFSASIPVEAGLQYVIFKSENTFGGIDIDTFTVKQVVNEDFINVSLKDGSTELKRIFRDEDNTVSGVIASGSNVTEVKYSITKGGNAGAYQTVALTGDPTNELEFSFQVVGEAGMEGITIQAENNGSKINTLYLPIPQIQVRATYLQNVEMSSDPADNKCFFSAYMTTHVFGKDEAIQHQDMIDWVLALKPGTTPTVQPVSPHAYGANADYYNATLPYLSGFTQLTYLFLTSKRTLMVRDGFDAVTSESEIITYVNTNGGYANIAVASRRVGDTWDPVSKNSGGFIIGWGTHTHPTVSPAVPNNVAFGMVWLKSVTKKDNGHFVIVFDIKFPKDDKRTPNNTSAIVPYAPYPL